MFSMRWMAFLHLQSAYDVIARIDIFHISRESAGTVADKECGEDPHILNAHEPVLWRAGAGPLQKLVETLDARGSSRLERTRRQCVNADAFWPKLGRHIANRGLQRGFHRTHQIILLDDLLGTIEGDGEEASALAHERLGQTGHTDEGMAGDVHRQRKASLRAIRNPAVQILLRRIGDRMEQEIEASPLIADA